MFPFPFVCHRHRLIVCIYYRPFDSTSDFRPSSSYGRPSDRENRISNIHENEKQKHQHQCKINHKRQKSRRLHDHGLPALPLSRSRALYASVDVQDALQDLTHSASQLRTLTVTAEIVDERDEAWRVRRRSYLGLELQRTDHFMDEAMEAHGECIDARLEKALRFSEWAHGNDGEMPQGLASALDVLLAEDE